VADLTLFISHSSADAGVAQALVHLVEKALKLPAREIRCTSVDGYRLPVGADTSEQLRREIDVARAFVGVITKRSVQSAYVMFELGARWGAKKHLAPVLARNSDPATLSGPLRDLNALALTERNQVLQLVEDLAEYLELRVEPAASFQNAVDTVVAEASLPEEERAAAAPAAIIRDNLSEDEIKVLQLLAEVPDADESQVARHLGVKQSKAEYYLSRLQEVDMVGWVGSSDRSMYFIEQAGRAALVKRNLL
jgi:hypothetical protein